MDIVNKNVSTHIKGATFRSHMDVFKELLKHDAKCR
jgi:hypothetical protein